MNIQRKEVNMGYFEDMRQKVQGMWQLMTGDFEGQRLQGRKGGKSSMQGNDQATNHSERKHWEDEEE